MSLRKTVLVLGAVLLCTGALMADEGKPPAVMSPAALHGPGSPGQVQPALPNTEATRIGVPEGHRQGGDTCDTATVIGGIPYTDTGTTAGYVNDYDEVCPYTGSTAPDVAYSFTPGSDIVVDITLCIGITDYDTKLYVYQGSCPGTLVACNDDACSSPYYSSYVSQLVGVSLPAGSTYYIIIDGYGTSSGNYTIDIVENVPPPPECPEDAIFAQERHGPDDGWSFGTSDTGVSTGYVIYENVWDVPESICDVHWWGLDLFWAAGWSECVDTAPTFEIKFYPDAGGVPDYGFPLCEYTVVPTVTPVELYAGVYMCNKYEVELLIPCCTLPGGIGWISIQDVDADCVFLWASSWQGDGDSLQQAGADPPTSTLYDRALCLTGVYVETYGACCDDSTSICTDNVEQLQCLPPLRFAADTLCADLVPPCGEIFGACCFADGSCVEMTNDDCTAQGGVWQGADTTCDPNPCVGACCYATQPCEILTEAACEASMGQWLGGGTTCDMCPCIVFCPPEGLQEQEPCGQDTNGGCNMAVPAFEPIECGQTICGTFWGEGGTRDTDWYEVVTTEPMILTQTLTAEGLQLGYVCGLIEMTNPGSGDCADSTGSINPYMYTYGECEELSVTTECLGPGTHWFFVGLLDYYSLPCNGDGDYVTTLTCEPCEIPTGACCLADGTCQDGMYEAECGAAGGVYQGDWTECATTQCPPTGACCFADQSCLDLTADGCAVYQGMFQGEGTECATTDCPELLAADLCADAVPVAVPSSTPGTTTGATPDSEFYGCGTSITAPGVWARVTGTGNTMTATTCTPFYDYDTKISVFCDGCYTADWACIAGNDDNCVGGGSSLLSTVTWCSNAGEDYLVLIHGYSSASGDFVLDVYDDGVACTGAPSCAPPETGACCLQNGTCIPDLFESDCAAQGGQWQGAGTGCDPNPCEPFGCTPCYSDPDDDWIANVTFVTINNTTGPEGAPCSYGDYTHLSTQVEPGGTYNMSVSFDGNGSWTEYVTAWFDFDHDMVLETSYQIGSGACTPGTPVTVSADITIPAGAMLGDTLMRVIERYSTWTIDPCEVYTYGEAEDYTVTVGEYQPTYGACCDDSTGICTDNVEQLDCPAPLRFAADTLCADLEPPCGEPLGACCFPDQSCQDLSAIDCAAAGGNYMGAGTDCATTNCPPGNDDCADAMPIGNVFEQPFDTTLATNDGDGTCMTSPNIWYCYTATCTTDVLVSLCGSSYDTKLAVYDSCDCGAGLPTRQIACNDDSGPGCPGLQSSALVSMIAGNEYLIEVGGYSSNSGPGVLTISMFGDFDYDGDIDGDDYAMFLAAFGSCSGDAAYLAAADFDGDGCIGLADYQAFVAAYRACNPGAPLPTQGVPGDMNQTPGFGTTRPPARLP